MSNTAGHGFFMYEGYEIQPARQLICSAAINNGKVFDNLIINAIK